MTMSSNGSSAKAISLAIIVFAFLWLPSFAFASLEDYSRTPSDTTILYGTNLHIEVTNTDNDVDTFYRFAVENLAEEYTYGECGALETAPATYEWDIASLPAGNYTAVRFLFYITEEDCDTLVSPDGNGAIEGDASEIIFEITNTGAWIPELITAQIVTVGELMPPVLFATIVVSTLLIGAGWAWSRFKRHVSGKKI